MNELQKINREKWKEKNVKKIWNMTFHRCYWPNSIRYEDIDWDGEKMYRCIYINGERVDTAPLCATEQEARMRLLELCEKHNVDEEQRVWKPRN